MPTPLPQTVLRTFALLAVLGGGLLAAAVPASRSERHPTLIELEGEVICPTCHTTLDQSDAPAARRIAGAVSARQRRSPLRRSPSIPRSSAGSTTSWRASAELRALRGNPNRYPRGVRYTTGK